MKSRFNFCNTSAGVLLVFAAIALPLQVVGHTESIVASFWATPIAQEFTRTITKDFPISNTGVVSLSNKYGKVDVKTWDKARCKIEVTVVVNARSKSAAETIFDRIRIDFENRNDFVSATTQIDPQNNSWFNWNWTTRGEGEFQINYLVHLPVSASLTLRNKYGDSEVGQISGKAEMDIRYGNLLLQGVDNDLSLKLGYGNGTVIKAHNVSADVEYGKLNLNNAGDINLTSKYSKINVDQANQVTLDSRYDNFNFGQLSRVSTTCKYGDFTIREVNGITAETKYTDFKINRLTGQGKLNLHYGGLSIDKLARGFGELDITGKYADVKIYMEDGSTYVLDVSTKYAGIAYPAGLNITYEKEQGSYHEVKGHVGASGVRSVIKATLEYGGFKIRQ